MRINKVAKRKVIEDWQNAFPQLTLYKQDKFYKILGPIIIGMELIKLPRTEEYRPYSIMYSLWEKDVKTTLDKPVLLKQFYNNKKNQFNLSYEKHDVLFSEALESIRKQIPLSFDGNIPLKEIFSVLDEYSQTPPLSVAPNSYLQAMLQETRLGIALFMSVSEAQNGLEQINKRKWDANHFKMFGIDIHEWLQGLQERVSHREEFLKQIEINKQDKEIRQLKSSTILS